jgi:hypothetical protein
MIYDRTAEDVSEALRIREEKVKNFIALTEGEKTQLERGMITYNTLNRIENKQAELKALLENAGYYMDVLHIKSWSADDIFNEEEFEILIENLDILRNAFFTYTDTPETPAARYHYEEINALEKILFDLEKMINDMKSRYRECGTFECGEE